MASQQRALQSYMDSMFASVPHASTSQGTGLPMQGNNINNNNSNNNNNNMMQQQNFSAPPASLAPSMLIGNDQKQQQQQMFHPGVPTIFQPGGNTNTVSPPSFFGTHSLEGTHISGELN